MDSSGDGILVLDATLRVAKLNAAAARIFEARRDDLVGLRVTDLLGDTALEQLERVVTGDVNELGAKFELERTWNGNDKVLSVGASRCTDGDIGTELLLIVRDMTEERKLQARLSQAQKMDSLGALAGGMAHDFNNILATILPHAEMIRYVCEGNQTVSKRARAIESAARRGGELTRRLLAFARPKAPKECVAIPNSCVESTVAMLRDTLDRKIRVECRLMEERMGVAIDPSQLEHVLLNLAINARDAMPDGGVLRFETKFVPRKKAVAVGAERMVQIVVEDSGHGMDETTARKVFDPFFTTKEGRGTGLGLSTAYSIVNAAGGLIEVESRVGRGSSFKILLPVVKVRAVPSVDVATIVRGQKERVLVVDDEATVRELTVEMLGRLGYQVTSADSGEEAIALVSKGVEFDLILLDMIMPDKDGRDTYRAIRGKRPDLAFVIASGDPDNPKTQELASEGVAILQKPFNLAALSVHVHAALAERRPAEKVGKTA
jgi:PAS domain S-box-containing protein